MVEAGAHAKVIQDRLGHASIRTTMDVYGHVFPANDAVIAKRLDDRFRSLRGLDAASSQ